MAAVLLASGQAGHRTSHPHCRIMIHEAATSVTKHQTTDVVLRVHSCVLADLFTASFFSWGSGLQQQHHSTASSGFNSIEFI